MIMSRHPDIVTDDSSASAKLFEIERDMKSFCRSLLAD